MATGIPATQKTTRSQQAATREALAYWDDLIPLRFQEQANGHGNWDMAFATTTSGPGQAWAYLPHGIITERGETFPPRFRLGTGSLC